MRIVLDLQACQSPGSGQRGIGRYAMALAKAMLAAPRSHEFVVALNAAMPQGIEMVRGKLGGYLGHHDFAIWRGLDNAAIRTSATSGFRGRASALLREDFIAGLNADYCHTMSLFEGWSDDVATAIRPDISNTASAVTLYDLIPLAQQETYLRDPGYRSWYFEKIENLRRAQLMLVISEFASAEAQQLLGISSNRLVNISGAADDIFRHLDDAESLRTTVMRRYGLLRKFVMYAGGFDERKNLIALVNAYARLPFEVREIYQLLMVGSPSDSHRMAIEREMEQIGLRSEEVVFCGYVPDRDLVYLYNLCALYVFPSLQEGFGLPALEAMACGAPVIGSSTSSLPEVIGREDALFNPLNVDSIAQKMLQGLCDKDFQQSLREHARLQPKKFSWEETARRTLDAFEAHAERLGVAPSSGSKTVREVSSCAWLPACPQKNLRDEGMCQGTAIFVAEGCPATWVEPGASKPLSKFDPTSAGYEKIVIDVVDHPYCAETLTRACGLQAELHVYSECLGRALAPMSATEHGRELLVAMAYEAGGYAAVRRLCDDGFDADTIDDLIDASALCIFDGCTVVFKAEGAIPSEPSSGGQIPLANLANALRVADCGNLAGGAEWREVAESLAINRRYGTTTPQLLVDISHLFIEDAHTGIQRVVKNILNELLFAPPAGYRIEPIVLGEDGVFRYARSYCNKHYFPNQRLPANEVVEFSSRDLFLGLDLTAHLVPVYLDRFIKMKALGVRQYFVIYDLLPILRPDCFDPNSVHVFRRWYESVAHIADGVLCISRAVADEFEAWLHQARPKRENPLGIGVFHLGADLPKPPLGANSDARLDALQDRPTFLMVGTVEPRKGHTQTLSAFEHLWKEGVEVNLLIVGKPGWLVDSLLLRLREHPLRGSRLFWFEKADDDLLLACYERASALLMASEGEGFGLPLIEAAHHGLPLVVRDLPVFREIVGDHAHYFSGLGSSELASSIQRWLLLDGQAKAPQSGGMCWKTWSESAAELADVLLNERWVHAWKAADVRIHAAYDYRFHTQVGRLAHGLMETTGSEGFLLYGLYLSLEAGTYGIDLRGTWDGDMGVAWMDVCSGAGTEIHVRCNLFASNTGLDGLLGHIELVLDADVVDLEVRVGVDANTRMRIRALEIYPLSLVVENQGQQLGAGQLPFT